MAGIFVDWHSENGQSSVRSDIFGKLTEYAAPTGLDFILGFGSTEMPRLRRSEAETQSFAERCFDLFLLFVQLTLGFFNLCQLLPQKLNVLLKVFELRPRTDF
jgi:hypothetical protein